MSLERQLINNKSNFIYRGTGAITFGLVALCYPGDEINALSIPFGILLILSGLIIVLKNINHKRGKKTRTFLLMRKGVAELLIGVLALLSVILQLDLLWELMALWVITMGVLQILNFTRINQMRKLKRVMLVLGYLAVIFGTGMLMNNFLNIFTPTYELAIFAIFYGSCFIYIFFKLKEKQKHFEAKEIKIFPYETKAFYE